MSFNLVAAEKAGVAVAVLCRALGVSRSGFYARRGRGDPPKVARARKRDVAVAAVFKEKRERYGAPRVRAVLRARGEAMSRKSVAASMRAQGLVARPRRRFVSTTDSSHGRPTPPNLVNRNFCAAKPNEVWVADTTYLPTQSGFVYLVCVLDLFARRLVGWSVADDLSADLAALALRRATAERRPPPGAGRPHGSRRRVPLVPGRRC
ncbi:MAG: IS3 family transposase [Polyangiaceae bacterium]|nr:IS3 family transposase [Polyangiaceae bacterium]